MEGKTDFKRPSWIIASFLNVLLPGLGFIYIKKYSLGASIFFGLLIIVTPLVVYGSSGGGEMAVVMIVVPMTILFSTSYLTSFIQDKKRKPEDFVPKPGDKKKAMIIVIAIVSVVIILALTLSFAVPPAGSGKSGTIPMQSNTKIVTLDDCKNYIDDTCLLFACMVENCWCDHTGGSPILKNGQSAFTFITGQGAMDAVDAYLKESGQTGYTVKDAVPLNGYFQNVFVQNSAGDEITYTITGYGEILKTVCGV